jgi:GNAT superfamily N-acetyltransferase
MNLEFVEGFTIKIATNEDSRNIIKMLKQIALWLKKNEINQWSFLLDGGEDEEIEQAISNQETFIVSKDNEMVATFTLLTKQSEWDRHIWGGDDLSSHSLYLHRLAITPTYMKKGMGRSILNWIINKSSDQEYLKLDCVADNIKLNEFYKVNKFQLVGLTDGHSKYQMSLKRN